MSSDDDVLSPLIGSDYVPPKELKLFFWTYHEYETCRHHIAIAVDHQEAVQSVVDEIKRDWSTVESPDEYTKEWEKEDIESFLYDTNWKYEIRNIKVGCLI